MKYTAIIIAFLSISLTASSQRKRVKTPGDTLTALGCPLATGVMKSPTQDGAGYKGDMKMIITSVSDTLVLAPADGKIDLISMGEGGHFEVVMHHGDYNIWLTGISKLLVKKGDLLKKGQPVGKVIPGEEVELLFFNDEEPVDPKKLLNCKQ